MGHYYNIREKQGPGHKYSEADFAFFVENADIAIYNVAVVLDVCVDVGVVLLCGFWCELLVWILVWILA